MDKAGPSETVRSVCLLRLHTEVDTSCSLPPHGALLKLCFLGTVMRYTTRKFKWKYLRLKQMKPDTGAALTESLPGVTKGTHRGERGERDPTTGLSEAGLAVFSNPPSDLGFK